MSKRRILAGGVAVAIIAVAAAAPYVVGQRIETRFKATVQRVSARIGQPIKITSYHAGWLTSESTTRMTINDQPVILHYDIQHGPFMPLAWARIKITPDQIGGAGDLKYYFDGPAFAVTGTAAFGGDMDVDMRSPAFAKAMRDNPGQHMVWGGLTGSYRRQGHRARLNVSAPKFIIRNDAASITARGLQIASRGHTPAGRDPSGADKIDWNGRGTFTIDRLSFSQPAANTRYESGLKFESRAHSDPDGPVDFHYAYDLTDLEIDDPEINGNSAPLAIPHARLAINLAGLKQAPLTEMLDKVRAMSGGLSATQDPQQAEQKGFMMLGMMASYAQRILSGTPSLSIDIPPLATGHGKFSARAHARLTAPPGSGQNAVQNAGAISASSLFDLVARLQVNAREYADANLMQWIISRSSNPARARQTLTSLLQQHMLEEKDGRIGMRLHYDARHMTLNGRPVPPSLLHRLLPTGAAAPPSPARPYGS